MRLHKVIILTICLLVPTTTLPKKLSKATHTKKAVGLSAGTVLALTSSFYFGLEFYKEYSSGLENRPRQEGPVVTYLRTTRVAPVAHYLNNAKHFSFPVFSLGFFYLGYRLFRNVPHHVRKAYYGESDDEEKTH